MPKFADVILPLPIDGSFTYELSGAQRPSVGARVVVPFGARRYYTAVVVALHDNPPAVAPKPVLDVLDENPLLLPVQLALWQWMRTYYCCTLGDIYKMAIPAGFRLESETILQKTPAAAENLPPRERNILDAFGDEEKMELSALQRTLGAKNLFPLIKKMVGQNLLQLTENVTSSYRPRLEPYVRILPSAAGKLTEKQRAVLQVFAEKSVDELPKSALRELSAQSDAVIATLAKNGFLEIFQKEKSRLRVLQKDVSADFSLSAAQQKAYDEIRSAFREKNTVLLHGVTASGKTEIYIRLIQNELVEYRQVLFLVPEIALAAQLTDRLRKIFGDDLGVYHSGLSAAERVEIWQKMLGNRPYKILLGARSAVFLPLKNLGLTIVDEEHETSYKQQDSAPHYHARNIAVMLGALCRAKTLLGTATPSVESFHNSLTRKFALVELSERYGNASLPEIVVADTATFRRRKQMKSIFSPPLFSALSDAFSRKEQAILFQNRRGYAPVLECKACGFVPKCKFCDVALTRHKASGWLECHYCGRTYSVPEKCPQCGGGKLAEHGFGTERVEDEVHAFFPDARVARLDLDSVRRKDACERIISDFEQGKIDVLVGTQMVTKGLDFANVSVVGVLNADSLLNYPDFRANEQAFQMLMQVSGRAGRKDKKGTVVVQTAQPQHPVFDQVRRNDFRRMMAAQLAERKMFRYPPYFRLISLSLKHKDEETLVRAAEQLGEKLSVFLPENSVLGPEKPPVSRVNLLYIRRILVKLEVGKSAEQLKARVAEAVENLRRSGEFSRLSVAFDVDPL